MSHCNYILIANKLLTSIRLWFSFAPALHGYKNENFWAEIGDEIILKSNEQELLCLQIDRNLNFNENVSSLCKKLPKSSQFLRDYQNSWALNKEEF